MVKYIYQSENWPHFTWNEQEIQVILGKVRHIQGKLTGHMSALGFSEQADAMLSTLTQDVLKSSEIEGEILNYEQVRSSIARKLGIEYAGMIYSDRNVDGVVEMMLDATQNYNNLLDEERLFGWHAALFPTGRSGLHNNKEMDVLLHWFNNETKIDLVLKSAIVHFWFIIIHPFDDGNGRIARALSDLLLARSDNSPQRFYSLSSQILVERKVYYEILQKVQYSNGDITEWLIWFLNCLYKAIDSTGETIEKVLYKAHFWDRHKETVFNSRQRLMLNKLFDGFTGKLNSSKWAKIAKCSSDTALRDIQDLIKKGILQKESAGGRSTNYELIKIPADNGKD
ncbi:MAG: cell filamentation protein Fic [Bacteroidetes bacterium GWF2_40_14]|nr:MAG: cell filamentation protein Fic [Bacteroidetes bacterium GWF2_40_14]